MPLLLVTLAASLATSCATPVPLPEEVPADVDPHAAWARVLQTRIDDQGRVDFDGLSAEPQDLDAFVAWVGEQSPVATPEHFPDKADKLAYYLNAYNALCLYNVVHGAEPDYALDFFQLRSLPMGGGYLTLERLREIIRRLDEPRVHLALTANTRTEPRLRREPYRAATIDSQLDDAARRFLNDPANVRVLGRGGIVRLSPVLQSEREHIERAASRSLIGWMNRFREQPIATSARVEFLRADPTLRVAPASEPQAEPQGEREAPSTAAPPRVTPPAKTDG